MSTPPLTAEQVVEWLNIIDLMEDALDGDGSTEYMPDVTQGQAARYIISNLYANGYAIVRVKG